MDKKGKEIGILLGIIRQYNPALYRHLVGMIREIANAQIRRKPD